MKTKASSKLFQAICSAVIGIVGIGAAAAPIISAAPNPKKADKPASVVAHLDLSGSGVTRMLLVGKDGKQYLVLGLDSSARIALVDVSESARPRMIATSGGTNAAPANVVEAATDLLTIFGTSDAGTAASSQPKEIRTLSAVTTFVKDQAHGIIYAANGEGLWVVKTKQANDLDSNPDYYGGGG